MTVVVTKRWHLHLTRKIRACTAIHQLSYSPSFAVYSVVDSMSVNDTTGAVCTDISYTASTSEHTPTPAFWLALMLSFQLGVEKGNVMKLIGRDSKRKRALNLGEAYVNRKNRRS